MRLLDSVLMTMGLSQPFRRFLGELLMLRVIVPGRATFLNLSRYSDYAEKTFRRWFRRQVDWAQLNVTAIRAVVPCDHESVLAFDPSFVPKSGQRTAGLGRFWNGGAGRAEPGLEINALAWVDVTAHTAYTLSADLTPPEPVAGTVPGASPVAPAPAEVPPIEPQGKGKGKGKGKTKGKGKGKGKGKTKGKGKGKTKGKAEGVEASRVDAYLGHLQRVIPHHDLVTLRYLTADGYFGKVKFVDGVKALNLELISKLRRDADLRHLYEGPYAGRGRPQLYDGKVDLSQRERFIPVPSPDPERILETAVVYAPRLRRRLRIVVVTHRRHGGLAVLFSTDLDLDPVALYRYYVARFQIEFLFRDSKQFAGLTHGQARDVAALTFHANASLTAVSLSKLQAVQTLGQLPVPFSMASLVRRCFNEYFLKKILACLAEGRSLAEKSPDYETLCNHGIIHPVAA